MNVPSIDAYWNFHGLAKRATETTALEVQSIYQASRDPVFRWLKNQKEFCKALRALRISGLDRLIIEIEIAGRFCHAAAMYQLTRKFWKRVPLRTAADSRDAEAAKRALLNVPDDLISATHKNAVHAVTVRRHPLWSGKRDKHLARRHFIQALGLYFSDRFEVKPNGAIYHLATLVIADDPPGYPDINKAMVPVKNFLILTSHVTEKRPKSMG